MLNIVLYQPEIPPNTGNIIRLCANTGATLQLVGPLGFQLDEQRVRRAGLDYAELAKVHRHESWQAFLDEYPEMPLWTYSTRGTLRYDRAVFTAGDGLVFGPETRGLPAEVLQQVGHHRCLKLPMQDSSRSLNLANTVAVAVYEAWRQLDFRLPAGN